MPKIMFLNFPPGFWGPGYYSLPFPHYLLQAGRPNPAFLPLPFSAQFCSAGLHAENSFPTDRKLTLLPGKTKPCVLHKAFSDHCSLSELLLHAFWHFRDTSSLPITLPFCEKMSWIFRIAQHSAGSQKASLKACLWIFFYHVNPLSGFFICVFLIRVKNVQRTKYYNFGGMESE